MDAGLSTTMSASSSSISTINVFILPLVFPIFIQQYFKALKQLSYTDRLEKLKMPTLKYRRLRGDMIETFKIINGISDKEVTERFLK
jgi:hypothetical protein